MQTQVYKSKQWLVLKYVKERWTEQEIADYCEVNQSTINRWLRRYELKK